MALTLSSFCLGITIAMPRRERCEQEVSHSVSGAAICSSWASHLTRAPSLFLLPREKDVKEEDEEEEKSNWGYTSFFPRSKTPSDCIRMNYWQLFFIAPRFWKLVPFRSGTQDREHVSKRNWTFCCCDSLSASTR